MSDKLPPLATPPITGAKAALDQYDIQPWESDLLAVARIHHPTVAWWHGYRKGGAGIGSTCYICDRMIVSWPSLLDIPEVAVESIDAHKYLHRDGLNLTPPTTEENEAPQ